MVAVDNRYEGAYVMKRDGYYYLFGSSANCCAGPTTGYSVYVGRAKTPRGPFRDKQGQSMAESRVGGTIVITPNGNSWIGPGHNAAVTDLSGEDFFVYHAIDRADPYLDEPYGINERPMLIDRLDWIGGWPTVRGGRWASETTQRPPVTDGSVNDAFNRKASLGRSWDSEGGAWRLVEQGSGGYARQQGRGDDGSLLIHRSPVPDDVRIEGDLRLGDGGEAAGIVVRYGDKKDYAAAWLDREANALVTDVVTRGGSTGRKRTPLPAPFAFEEWHNVAVEVRGREMTVEVTDARLRDPLAEAGRTLPRSLSDGRAGVSARGRADADNVSAAKLYTPDTKSAPTPEVGEISTRHSDEFDGSALEPEWSFVRQPDGQVAGGSFEWTTQEGDIVGTANDASVLLRDAPEGRYVVETRLTMENLGVAAVRNFQQGGMIAYADDDLWARLSHVAIFNTRQTEFAKEMPFAGELSFGGMLVGPPSGTTWMRLAHRVDRANGEHEFRAATSRDGRTWTWGGTWTLPADTEPRIGLLSLGKAPDDPAATARFDYFRVYRPQ